MFPEGDDKLNRIEELKSKLFNKNYETKTEYRDSFHQLDGKEIRDSWEEENQGNPREKFFIKTSMFKKFFIFSTICFILALGYAAYTFFANNNSVSNDNIDISVLSNAFTAGGEDYSLLLAITNKNNSPLELSDLVIEYPKNSEASSSEDNEHLRISLGTIPAGATKDENVRLVFYGEQGSTRDIKISLEYRVEGSNAIFVKEKDYTISIDSTPINLSVDAPSEISSNQNISLNIKASLNATRPVGGMFLKVDYPIGFQFTSATPAPSIGNNIWDLGDFAPGVERNIVLDGKMVDVFNGDQKVFRVAIGTQSDTDKSQIGVVFNSVDHTVNVKQSAIEADVAINGISDTSTFAIDSKTPIQGQIKWKNNLETKIENLKIVAKVSGNALNRKTISTDGFYDSSQDTIVWDKNSQSNFVEISPGDSGAVSFSMSSIPLYGANGALGSPTINIDLSITGQTQDAGGNTTDLGSTESKVIKITSDVGLSNKALYYTSSLKNSGPIPPKVGQKTTYTIVWSVSNTANNISKAQVSSTIPSWVKFIGKFSPDTEGLSYDDVSRQITWNVGGIPRGTGINGSTRQVSFQIELTPSLSQVGTPPVILNNTTLTGYDDFANVDVRVNKAPLNTRLLGDSGFPPLGGNVVE